MITTNYAMNNTMPSFKENSKPDYEELVKRVEELGKPAKQEKIAKVKKAASFTKKLRPFLNEAQDFLMASGLIAAKFIWNRITALVMCLWTIPGIIAAVTLGTIAICKNYIDKHEYPDGHEKYKIETIDKKAAKNEELFNKNPQKYYEKTSSTIFNYYDALNQITAEKEALETKISNLTGKENKLDADSISGK